MTPERAGHKILVVADDALLAALVGSIVESVRYTAVFPSAGESPDQAVVRVKPLAAVLLDAGESSAQSDLLLSRTRKLGARLMLFGDRVDARATWARANSVLMFRLPQEIEALSDALEALLPDGPRPRGGRSGERREAERRPDGSLVFTDAAGVRWSVYDRRGAERRGMVDRRFVSDSGRALHCDVPAREAAVISIDVLSAQLERAQPE